MITKLSETMPHLSFRLKSEEKLYARAELLISFSSSVEFGLSSSAGFTDAAMSSASSADSPAYSTQLYFTHTYKDRPAEPNNLAATQFKLEDTHRVQTHAELLSPNPNIICHYSSCCRVCCRCLAHWSNHRSI